MLTASQSVDALLEVRAAVCHLPPRRNVWLESGAYVVRLAACEKERSAAFRLRFVVFNLELNEGLESAFADGYDTDRYDSVCEHLIVEHRETRQVVGTYRLQDDEWRGCSPFSARTVQLGCEWEGSGEGWGGSVHARSGGHGSVSV